MIDWGSVPDWFAGVGALVALVFAARAVRTAKETNRAQNEQIKQLQSEQATREYERRADQASRFATWVSTDIEDGLEQVVVRVINSGTLPVYSLTIFAETPAGVAKSVYPVFGPDPRRNSTRMTAAVRALVSGKKAVKMFHNGDITISCSFRDSAGQWWYRKQSGELVQANDRGSAEAAAAKRL